MKIDFNELVAIAFLERSRRYNLKIKDSIRQKAKEAIERHNLTQEQINLIYKVFTGDSQAECNHPLPAGLSYPSNQTPHPVHAHTPLPARYREEGEGSDAR
ncbi:hypothetical protein Asulf_01494 [Archaeoglobus sulfaticallidus PM70-1]|uniref:Uncharacterized protein n=1 Tax=Archaeoglobus sulfaticallidus PM70-1 TaxID=387631 RepID=N0BGT1_9EURY|nr:hypothetical protein [Archaeoglobus sulfaticallidus]AGK61477.1 hypothetical protein Asulf_01494 [Archaeoglobus sulfaticallidus PM70-1]